MIIDDADLRERTRVFQDRFAAGRVLARLLEREPNDALLLAIPSGGVPVACAIAEQSGRTLDVAVVSKITLPWNTEAGYGAVAFDGSSALNDELLPHLGLSPEEIEEGLRLTRGKVARRITTLRQGRAAPPVAERDVILVDDGLASGLTMRLAIEAVRRAGANRIVVAVPTAHSRAAERIAQLVDAVYCANLRGGRSFAVADAYASWRDVAEEEVAHLLTERADSGCHDGTGA